MTYTRNVAEELQHTSLDGLGLQAEGYEIRRLPWSEWTELDAHVAETSACPRCASACRYVGAVLEVDGRRISYRAFSVCTRCEYAVEF
jgi:hypothetical protein